MNDLKFYYISLKYLEYIRKFDNKIPLKKRPFLFLLETENYYYLVPLYSAKEKHKNYFMNGTFFRMYDWNNCYIGIMKFTNMIPVPKKYANEIEYNTTSKLFKEEYYILKHRKQILKKAIYTYNNYDKFRNICVNFKKIEKICSSL